MAYIVCMGWSGGSELMIRIIDAIEGNIDPDDYHDALVSAYGEMISAFEGEDCDTLYECCDSSKAFEEAYKELHPDELEDEDEDEQ